MVQKGHGGQTTQVLAAVVEDASSRAPGTISKIVEPTLDGGVDLTIEPGVLGHRRGGDRHEREGEDEATTDGPARTGRCSTGRK